MVMNRLPKRFVGYILLLLLMLTNVLSVTSSEEFSQYALDDVHYSNGHNTPKRAAVFLDKLVMAVQRAMNKQQQFQAQRQHFHQQQQQQQQQQQDLQQQQQPSYQGGANWQRNLLEVNSEDGQLDKNSVNFPRMGLERRGQKTGRVYWRCYFNAVSCFRKK